MSKRLQLALRRFLEVVLVMVTVVTGYAAIRGQVSASTLSAMVTVLIAIGVTIDYLNRGDVRRGRCAPRAGK